MGWVGKDFTKDDQASLRAKGRVCLGVWGGGRGRDRGLRDQLGPDGQGSWEATQRHHPKGSHKGLSEKEGRDQACPSRSVGLAVGWRGLPVSHPLVTQL